MNVSRTTMYEVNSTDEKYFQLYGIYNRQNVFCIYATTHGETDHKRDIHRKAGYPTKIMLWLGAYFQGVIRPVIIEEGIRSMLIDIPKKFHQ